MSDLLLVEFPSEEKAESAREILLAMQKEYRIEHGDAVIAVRDKQGRVKLNRLFRPAGRDAVPQMPWEQLIGLLALSPPAEAARGALRDVGLGDDFATGAARTLQSGNAALFLLIRAATADKVLAALRASAGAVLRAPFDETKEEALQAMFAGARQLPGRTTN